MRDKGKWHGARKRLGRRGFLQFGGIAAASAVLWPLRLPAALAAALGNEEQTMSIRPIKRVSVAKPTIEGAGVRLRRAFGFGTTNDFDPFLLLDDFRNEDPADYRAGFPWHPHRGIETITYVLAGTVEHQDSLGAAGSVHTIAELRVLPATPIAESVWADLVPVSVDSTIAVNFSVSVGNETTVVPSTDAAAGQQAATAPAQNQLSSTYTITQIGIRRRPRFGPDAGVWTDLLAPADSEIGDLGALLDDLDLGATFASVVRFRWDDDVIVDNRIDNRRLLVNADTPYTFITGNPAADEGLLATDPSFPCCSGKRQTVSHVLNFESMSQSLWLS